MIQRRNLMATQTSLVAQQVRIRQWAEQIRNCQNRPKGMDVETWCTQNNLTKANYYYTFNQNAQGDACSVSYTHLTLPTT